MIISISLLFVDIVISFLHEQFKIITLLPDLVWDIFSSRMLIRSSHSSIDAESIRAGHKIYMYVTT